MKITRTRKWSLALGAGFIATLGLLPTARAELVYEPEVSPNAPAQVRADDREQTRQALDASQRAQNVVQVSQPAPQQQFAPVPPPAIQQVQAPVTAQAVAPEAPQTEVQSLSKTELMRRERTREELKNEDILQERLEELRLRDEKKRTNQLLGDGQASPDQPVAPIAGLAVPAAPQSQVIVSPVTDRPGQPAPEVATIPAQTGAANNSAYTLAAQNQMNSSQTTGASVLPEEKKPANFYLSPKAGISSMSTNGPFNVNGHFALGVSAGVNVSDNIAVEVGYTYSEYGIQYGDQAAYTGYSFDTYTLKQNVIDAVMKLYFLDRDSLIRPFIGGGGGYSMASLDYPSNVYQYAGANNGYSTNSFLGELTAGADVKVSKNISVGATFKYYSVLSSTQNNSNGLYYGGYRASAANSPLQAYTGASLSQSSFYQMLAGVTFSF